MVEQQQLSSSDLTLCISNSFYLTCDISKNKILIEQIAKLSETQRKSVHFLLILIYLELVDQMIIDNPLEIKSVMASKQIKLHRVGRLYK